MAESIQDLNVFFCCTGTGRTNRGLESFFQEAFRGLRDVPGIRATLWKGAGEEHADERVLPSVPRTSYAARLLGACLRRDPYVAEQLSALPFLIRAIRKHRPHIIFYSDSNLGFQLFRWRKTIGTGYRLLFSNGGPCSPPFERTDYVHQVAPHYLDEALAAGVPASTQRMVPYGIQVPVAAPDRNPAEQAAIRQKLNLPVHSKIVLSVGWISSTHKRMDYLVREIARLPEPRPHLLMLGHTDASSGEIIAEATRALGPAGFTVRSVPYEQVGAYYQSADLFTLASLKEGFGRVFLEALMNGLPCIVHDHPVMRFVLGPKGHFADLSKPGTLASQLAQLSPSEFEPDHARARHSYVRSRFDWSALGQEYLEMFRDCTRLKPAVAGAGGRT